MMGLMKYCFDKKYVKQLWEDSKKLYSRQVISKEEYETLVWQFENLMYRNSYTLSSKKGDLSSLLPQISTYLFKYDQMLDGKTLDSLLYVTDSILAYPLNDVHENITVANNEDFLLQQVLQIYQQFNIDDYEYLKNFITSNPSFLEFVKPTLFSRNKKFSSVVHLPYYNLSYVHFVKENSIFDIGYLAHELRHVLDMKEQHSLSQNMLCEANPLFIELYCNLCLKEENQKFEIGIVNRLNDTYQITTFVSNFLCLLNQYRHNKNVTIDMIAECFPCENEKKLTDIMTDLSSGTFDATFYYLLGTLIGVHLCHVTSYDMRYTKEVMKNIQASLEKTVTLCDVFSMNIGIDIKDMYVYHQFIEEEIPSYVKMRS